MGRYKKFNPVREKENAARRRNDGTKAEDLLIGNGEEQEFIKNQLLIMRVDQETIAGTLTGLDRMRQCAPSLDFVRRYNGPENTELAGWTEQTSQGIVPQYFHPATGAYFKMGKGGYAYEELPPRCRSVKTKDEALFSFFNARSASWRYQKTQGHKGAKDGYKGAEFGNKPPKPGKKARGWPKGVPRKPTMVNSEHSHF